MTPEQIAMVESTLAWARADMVEIAAEFYDRLFESEPELRSMFSVEPSEQQRLFAEHLDTIAGGIRNYDTFVDETAELGRRHRTYGVEPRHYALAGPPLLAAIASALGPAWTCEVETAWLLAYNLIVEAMMAGAAEEQLHPVRPS